MSETAIPPAPPAPTSIDESRRRIRAALLNARRVAVGTHAGEEVRVRMKSREQAAIQASMAQASRGAPLAWIAVDRESFSGRMLERPQRASIPIAAQEQLVVELYSK